MTKRNITIGGIYRHHKGGEYKVLAEIIAKENFTERQKIVSSGYKAIATTDVAQGDSVVIYKGINGLFAREKQNFLETLGETTMFYRFERIL